MTTLRFSPRALRATLLAAAIGAGTLTAAACGPDPFAPVADAAVLRTQFTLWAVTGSPPPYPTAFSVQNNATVRLEPSGSFDVAFDITPEGKLKVLPLNKVVAPVSGGRQLGLRLAGMPYAQVTSAPLNGYATDTVLEVDVGETFILRVISPICALSGRQVIYAKMVADTIVPADRRIFLVGRINPNCGFRSFADGIPEF